MLMNVLLVLTTVTPTQHVPTHLDHSHANVTVVSRETAKPVPMLMNVREALPNATRTPSVTTPMVVSNAHARVVSLVMAQPVPIMTSVLMVQTTVMPTPPAQTLVVDSAASAVLLPITSRTSMVTDKHVKTPTNAKPKPTHVTDKPSVPILMVDLHVHANPDSAETDSTVPEQPPNPHQLQPKQPQWLEHANHEAPTTVTTKPHVLITITVHSLANAKVPSLEMVSSVQNQRKPQRKSQQQLVDHQLLVVVSRELANQT
jgi:hypothetical protein